MKQTNGSPTEPILKFAKICRENGLVLDDNSLHVLREYVRLLLDWNTKVNLISRTDTSNIWFSHVLHSISILFFKEFCPNQRVLDLGTGGGLPGVPLAIVKPDVRFTLLDSIRKKTNAVQQMVDQLGLTSVHIETGRAEDLGRVKDPQLYDVVISRAVASLADLIRWSAPLLVRVDSRLEESSFGERSILPRTLIAYKGGDLAGEIRQAKTRTRRMHVSTINLTFRGSDEIGLQEKKLVIVQL